LWVLERETPMPIKAVVFDLGETLIDERRMWREWATYLGVPEQDFLAAFDDTIARGEHHRRVFDRFREGFDFEAARLERIENGTAYAFRREDLYPDAAPCLSTLRKLGYFIVIAVNQPREALEGLLALGLDTDLATTSAHLGFEKPLLAFFDALISLSGFRADEIAYVGDRVDNDILPAQAAGMVAVFIERGPWGRAHARRGDAARADVHVNTLMEISVALERLEATRPGGGRLR
jgi:FMN phosphatase YigB (HAD superfamily)